MPAERASSEPRPPTARKLTEGIQGHGPLTFSELAALDVEQVSRVMFEVFPQDDATNDLIFEVLARLARLQSPDPSPEPYPELAAGWRAVDAANDPWPDQFSPDDAADGGHSER